MATETPKAITALPESAAVSGEDYLVIWHGGATMKVLASLFRGAAGADGAQGPAGAAGADGVSPAITINKSGKVTTITVTDRSGTRSVNIYDGADGSVDFEGLTDDQRKMLQGDPGYTPVRGVDYWTAEDQAAIVAAAVTQIPLADGTERGLLAPVSKSDTMTQAVGVDEDGALWTAPGLPAVTSADEGKLLGVVGGAWGAVALENGEEMRF